MNKRIKQFAEKILRPYYPRVSRRLLDDLAERVVHEFDEKLDGLSFKEVHQLIEENFADDKRLSAAFQRQHSGGSEGVIEVIYLVRDISIGANTSIDKLVSLLELGIEEDPRYEVEVRQFLGPPPSPRVSPDQIRILVVTTSGYRPNSEDLQRIIENNPHRVVFVTTSDVQNRHMQTIANDILHESLIHKGEPHFCSFVPTIITPKLPMRGVPMETEPAYDRINLRLTRDKTVLTASAEDSTELPANPKKEEVDRWVRNVMCKQIGFAGSGGGASAYRFIALIRLMYDPYSHYPKKRPLPIDVFCGLSGGSLIGAYLAGNEPDFQGSSDDGFKKVLSRGEHFARMLPLAFLTTEPIQKIVDEDLNYQLVGNTSVRYHAITTRMCEQEPPGTPPQALVVTQGTLGQAARASSSLPLGFAPSKIDGYRYTDGMASAIVPTHVAIDFGADVVLAANCLPGPNSTNPFSNSPLGRFVYDTTFLGRYIDLWTWVNFLVQNASQEFGQWADGYYQFSPQNIKSFEFLKWGSAYQILEKAYCEKKEMLAEISKLQDAWEKIP